MVAEVLGRADTGRVSRRVTSPVLIGRSAEVEAATTAVVSARAGRARFVLVSGDAGIGKTRLVSEVCGRARQAGMLATVGGCVQMGDAAVAYAPLAEVLRDLLRQLGPAALTELMGPGAAEIRPLLGDEVADGASRGGGALFEHLLGLLVRLGERQPALMVFEDLHWADPSTRDLVAFLARNLREAAVAIVLTYRSDELHRRHPLHGLLADVRRDPDLEAIALPGLGRADVSALVGEISDEALPAARVDELAARSGGNPFYVEELIAAGQRAGLPASLGEAILARVSRLAEPVPAVLHEAAVLGVDIDDELLVAVSRRPDAEVAAALREAAAAQLLVIGESGCRFRHALTQEALYDDLLPGERARLHLAAALALQQERPGLPENERWAQLAYHASAAHDLPAAFAAAVRAGVAAERVSALAAAAAHFETALDLWDRVPDPASAAGMDLAGLRLRAAQALNFSRSLAPRAVALAEAAVGALDETASPERRALLLERLGRIAWMQQHSTRAFASYEQAVALLADRPPSAEKAFALAALGQSLLLRGRFRDAERALRDAMEVAARVGAEGVQGHALCSLGPTLVELGQVGEGLAALDRAAVLCREYGTTEDVCRTYANRVHSYYCAGRYAEAAEQASEGWRYAIDAGARTYGEAILDNGIVALTASGQWQQAQQAYAAITDQIADPDPYFTDGRIGLLLAQGRLVEARTAIARVLATTADSDDTQHRAIAALQAGELASAERRWDEARAFFDDGLAMAARGEDAFHTPRMYAQALRCEADRLDELRARRSGPGETSSIRDRADRLVQGARRVTEDARAGGRALLREPQAWLATAETVHRRIWVSDTPDDWAELATTWDAAGQPYPAARARYHQAELLLRPPADRDRAAAAAADALAVAERLGARSLADAVTSLAKRGRLILPDRAAEEPATAAKALNLTPREAEVLALLVAGRTNRQIARALFISEKTASVHVTNLLRKLGVANRYDAAAAGARAGISP
jgi:DNA-binding CsgD family transcriptional regulator